MQTNETAAKLKAMLSPAELAELEVCGEFDTQDLLSAQMQAKAGGKELDITFVAFTATPTDLTLQLLGTRPEPSRPP